MPKEKRIKPGRPARRAFVRSASLFAGACALPAMTPLAAGAWAAGSDAPEKAEVKIKELEADLALQEKAIELPWYFTAALLMMARDALKWSCVPKDSVVTVDLPGIYTIAIRLDNLPEEPPF